MVYKDSMRVGNARPYNSQLLINYLMGNEVKPLWFPGKVIHIYRLVKQEIVIVGDAA